ncbi:MAG: PAS domain S-box protein [Candidatus Omnitrophica bacterium]|nr:PAS domain S-box protein [Candidatus Omnitrophota bacterium]
MREFFIAQMDYIFFVYGLSFFLLSITSFFLSRVRLAQPFWKWIAFFGLLHGITEWMDMLALSMGDSVSFKIVRTTLLILSFLCFVEIAREDAEKRFGQICGLWIYAPLLFITLDGGWTLGGLTGINILSRYIFGVVGGLLAARVIIISAANEKDDKQSFAIIAWVLSCYVVTQYFAPKGTFLPASAINQDVFFSFLKFPVQLLRAILAFTLAIFVWNRYNRTTNIHKLETSAHSWVLSSVILTLIILGGIFTDQVGVRAIRQEKQDILRISQGFAAGINTDRVKKLTGTPEDTASPDYQRIKEQMKKMGDNVLGTRYVCLMGERDGKIFFYADTEPARYEAAALRPTASPGEVYTDAPEGLINVFHSGKEDVIGPYTDSWGAFISSFVPVIDSSSRKVVAVLGSDVLADDWSKNVDQHRLMPIFITFLFAVLFILFFLIYQHEQEIRQSAQTREILLEGLMSQLEDEHKNLETIFDSAQVGLLLVDSQLKVKKLNQIVLNMGGQDFFSVVDQQFGDALSCIQTKETEEGCGKTAECKTCPVRSMAEMILKTGQPVRGAEVSRIIHTPSGEHKLVWLQVNATPIEIKHERHILFSLENITERREIENGRQETLRRLETLMDAMPNAVFYKDVRGVFQGCNKIFAEIHGVARQDIIGKTVFDLVPRELAEKYHAGDLKLMNSPSTEIDEGKVQFADGTLRDVIFNRASFVGPDGKVAGMVGVMVDITERKKADELEKKRLREFEVFYKASVGREERILELKKEVERLKKELEQK